MSVKTAASWAALAQYVGFALQFASSVIVARFFLGPAEVGVFSLAFSAAAMIHGLQDFGLNRSIIGAPRMTRRIVRQSFSVSLVVGIGIAIAILLLAAPLARLYGNPDLFAITALIGVSFVFIPFTVVPLALAQRDMDFRAYALVDIGANIVTVGATLLTAWLGFSSLSLAFGILAYQSSRALFAQFVRPIWRVLPPSWRGTAGLFRYGLSASALSLTGSIGSRAPDLVIGKLIGEAALGLYSRATGLALQFRMLVGGPVASVLYPSLARAKDRGESLGPLYLRLTAALCAITWAAMAGLAVAAEPLINTLYGPRWLGAAPVLSWVALAQVFFIALPMQIEVGYLLGRWRRVIGLTMADAVISVGLMLLTAPYGLIWVAMSRVVHGLIWWVIHATFVQGLVGFSWRELLTLYAKTALAAFAAVVPLLVSYTLWRPAIETPLAALALLAGAGVALWYTTLLAVRHPSAADLADVALGKLRGWRLRRVPTR